MTQETDKTPYLDPFVWLEDKDSPEALEWTAAQNERTSAYFEERAGAGYAERMTLSEGEHFPIVQGEGGRCFVICERGDGSSAAELRTEDLLLIHPLGAALQKRLSARMVDILPAPGGERVLLTMLEPNQAFFTMAVIELEGERVLGLRRDVVCAIWAPDSDRDVLYTTYPRDSQPRGILMRYYSDSDTEEKLQETDDTAVSTLPILAGGQFYWKVKKNFQTDQIFCIDGKEKVLLAGEGPASLAPLGRYGARHYLITNAGAAGRKVITSPLEPGGAWTTVIPEEEGSSIKEGVLLADRILLIRMKAACCVLEAYDLQGRLLERIGSVEDCCNLSFGDSPMSAGCQSFDEGRRIYLQRETFLQPPEILLYDIHDGLQKVQRTEEALPETFSVRQYFVPSFDGIAVPIFVARDQACTEARQPALVFSYGGYAQPELPHSTNSTTGIRVRDWIEAGGIYVSCCLRGGNEYGEPWHEAGMLKNKKNVFADLTSVIRWLKESGELPVGKVAICGQSNGGLTVTATMVAAPEQMDCVIASVAHTDMMAFVRDARGPIYTKEYGDPRDPDMRPYLLSYSPYHNVRPDRAYSPIYFQVGECDNNVPSYHSKKMAARLEGFHQNTVLLRSLPHGGHDRGNGMERRLTFAEMRLFLAEQLEFPALLSRCGMKTKDQKWG